MSTGDGYVKQRQQDTQHRIKVEYGTITIMQKGGRRGGRGG